MKEESMIIRKQDDIEAASNADLLETYTALTGQAIKKFESRAIAERRVAMAILSAQNATGHAGVPKNTRVIEAKTVDEIAAKVAADESADTTTSRKENDDMATKKKARGAPASAKKKTAAKKTGAKRAAGATRTRTAGSTVEYQEVEGGRTHEGSTRTKVLLALKKRKKVTMEKLSEDVGFDARPYIAKLVIMGWATVTPAAE